MDSRIHVNFHYPWLPDDSHENGKQGFWRFLSFHHQQRLLVSCPPPSPFSPPPYIYQYICTCSQNQFHSFFFSAFFRKLCQIQTPHMKCRMRFFQISLKNLNFWNLNYPYRGRGGTSLFWISWWLLWVMPLGTLCNGSPCTIHYLKTTPHVDHPLLNLI